MTHAGDWRRLGDSTPAEVTAAVLEIHWAVQILAAAGQTFAAPKDDDSHRAVMWNDTVAGFLGQEFDGPYPFRLALAVEDFALLLLDRTDAALGSMPLAGATLDDAYAWLRTGLSQYMGGTGPRIDRPDFELPGHPVGGGARFTGGTAGERCAVAGLYRSAAAVLEGLRRSEPTTSPVRCWPHHFDIATLLTVAEARGPREARTIGVGLAPRGGGYDHWYWYVTPWPYPDASELPALAGPGEWCTEGWVGAVLPGHDVVAQPADQRQAYVQAYLTSALAASKSVLSG